MVPRLLIFFDDYSNTLVVGNTSRSITDRLRISREKLAYLVDSTAAPLATVALVTTWIGYQVSLIGDAIAPLDDLIMSPYSIFPNSILYSFYPFMAILLVVLVITQGASSARCWRRATRPLHRRHGAAGQIASRSG
ncbi:MAG: hypothetical protein CM15mP103_06680 [Gammaproteobacteria bacterium]|nr:MAG: hypothetical protein CM15mP103_06680 [Gammaproteobacteria bacterium]